MQFNILQLYLNGFLNYQHLYMNWIIHFEFIETTIQMLHIIFITIFWNGCIKTWEVSHLYLNG
jgi:hypothetical protein